jgi:AcrR family transcriptional regulator
MSAANLYRYFENKSAIAAAGAERWLDQAEQHLRAVVADARVPARVRLECLVKTRIELFAALAARHSHLDELIADICAQRPDLTDNHGRNVRAIVEGILTDGIARGEVRALDTGQAARAICWATAAFDNHETVRGNDRAILEQAAESVVALLFDGLAPTGDSTDRTDSMETARS